MSPPTISDRVATEDGRVASRVVWKFPLDLAAETEINVPFVSQVRLVAMDPALGVPAMWLELDPEAPRLARRFVVYGTGHTIAGDGGFPSDTHVGSVIDMPFVWHVYERRDALRQGAA